MWELVWKRGKGCGTVIPSPAHPIQGIKCPSTLDTIHVCHQRLSNVKPRVYLLTPELLEVTSSIRADDLLLTAGLPTGDLNGETHHGACCHSA